MDSGIVLNLAGTIKREKATFTPAKRKAAEPVRMIPTSVQNTLKQRIKKENGTNSSTTPKKGKKLVSKKKNAAEYGGHSVVPVSSVPEKSPTKKPIIIKSKSARGHLKSKREALKSDREKVKVSGVKLEDDKPFPKLVPSLQSPAGASASLKRDIFVLEKFSDVPELNQRLVQRLESEGGFHFSHMTTIQKLTIPQLLQGNDCFVKSETGSGKTLAYAIPCVQKLSQLEPRVQRQDGPYAIVLTPTRELTIQTYEVFEKLLKAFIWIVPGYIAGGEKRKSEKARLRKGVNVLVCTPGRLTDHLKHTSSLELGKVQWVIYDEADRLLDGGFEADVKLIIDRLRQRSNSSNCQSVLLSATLNQKVSQLADLALVDSVFISPTSAEGSSKHDERTNTMDDYVLPQSLSQSYVVTPAKQRLLTLIGLILSVFKERGDDQSMKMLVFVATQDTVDFHYYLLDHVINNEGDGEEKEGYAKIKKRRMMDEDGMQFNIEIYRLHGSMKQEERTAVYKEFSKAKRALLLATDVAARGLHIPRLDCIVQYNTPGDPAEYVHRVGRTARMGQTGKAILFLMPSELQYLTVLDERGIRMRQENQNDFMESLMSESRVSTVGEALHVFQRRCEDFVYSRNDVYEMATKAFLSFVRSYAAYPANLKPIFNVRSVHLGHLAKCFSLKETPTEVAAHCKGGGHQYKRPGGGYGQRTRGSHPRGRQQSASRSHGNQFYPNDRLSVQYSRPGNANTEPLQRNREAWSSQATRHPKPFKRRGPVDMSEYGSGFDSIHSI